MITELQIDSWTRDLWSDFDAAAIAQASPISFANCYRPKFYKVPDSDQEVMAPNTYAEFGFTITPGSLLVGFHARIPQTAYFNYLVMLRDLSLEHDFWSQPIPGVMVQNQQKTSTYPNLLPSPHPVVGTGQFLVQIWNQITGNSTRIEIILAVAEVK